MSELTLSSSAGENELALVKSGAGLAPNLRVRRDAEVGHGVVDDTAVEVDDDLDLEHAGVVLGLVEDPGRLGQARRADGARVRVQAPDEAVGPVDAVVHRVQAVGPMHLIHDLAENEQPRLDLALERLG